MYVENSAIFKQAQLHKASFCDEESTASRAISSSITKDALLDYRYHDLHYHWAIHCCFSLAQVLRRSPAVACAAYAPLIGFP